MDPTVSPAADASRRRTVPLERPAILEAIREARAARREDFRMCRCGHPTSGHLVNLGTGEAFHCCEDGCGCQQYDEVSG